MSRFRDQWRASATSTYPVPKSWSELRKKIEPKDMMTLWRKFKKDIRPYNVEIAEYGSTIHDRPKIMDELVDWLRSEED